MQRKMQKTIGSVMASDNRGNVYRLLILQEFYNQQSLGDSGEKWLPGQKWYQTEEGHFVNGLVDGKFQIVALDIELTLVRGTN